MTHAAAPTRVLMVLSLPDEVVLPFHRRLEDDFPALVIDLVDHRSKVDPYIAAADIVMTFGATVTDELYRQARNLKWVQVLGTGVDRVIDAPSLGPDVIVTNMHGIHGPPVAEAAIAAMLALGRQLPRSVRAQDRHAWERFPIRLLAGKTVAIFGIGVIAAVLAPKLQALGMRVVGITSAQREVAGFERMWHRDELIAAVGGCDFLVLLTPHGPATHQIVGAAVLAALKPACCLVNLGRGGVVDEEAMIAALRNGRLGGAALDVFSVEPLPADHPLWAMENVLITPHIGGFYDEYFDRALPVVTENLRCFLAGDRENMINRVRRDRGKSS